MIGTGFVMTAAHCVDDVDGDLAEINVMSHGGLHPATALHVHPLWDGDVTHRNDLAVVRISSVGLSAVATVQACTPSDPGAYAADTPATVVGQGFTNPDGGIPSQPTS